MKTATFIKDTVDGTTMVGGRVTQKLWEVHRNKKSMGYIITSAVDIAFDTGRPETYIFPSDGNRISDFGELDGSYQGGADHEEALRRGGYEIVYPEGV